MASIPAIIGIAVIWGAMDAETGDKLKLTLIDLGGVLMVMFGPSNKPADPPDNTRLGMHP